MNRWLLGAAFLAALATPAGAVTQISVQNIGSILNESLALPAEDTPGSGIGFAEYFEFSIPTRETVTVSMSDSAIGTERVIGGLLSLNDHTSTGVAPLFIPAGALIDSSPFTNTLGGQTATTGPDTLVAGNYFTEISGTSGLSPIHIAIDGTATASIVPEPSTWAMLAIGFIALGAVTFRRQKQNRFAI
jgi:hypothetical protein